ncbi:type I-U CRISPR-associated protein Cas5/Cas6 [Leptolyngbya sp. 15MV]|nr:type I-U CRISPR-associated protein Cas5/Cas6 [Leptolyngbya sp. 15MV]
MATHPADRERAEWPPHPDRIFMALAAAHFETSDGEGGGAEEREALEWLQSLPAPSISVGDHERRELVTSYVPVNDTEIARPNNDTPTALGKRIAAREAASDLDDAKAKGLALMPEFRSRQPRSFPVAIPHLPDDSVDGMPRVHLIWDAEAPERYQSALAMLSAKVTSIGHSASLVQMWVEPQPPRATLVPVNGIVAKHRLRVFGDSRMAHLESRFKAGLRPSASLWQGYGEPQAVASSKYHSESRFDPNLLILRRIAGARLGLESTLQLVEALRGAVMSKCLLRPPPEWISGHGPAGEPSEEPHLAFMPLADVGHEHARGHLLGVAIVVPGKVSPQELKALHPVLFYTSEDEQKKEEHVAGMPRAIELTMGRAGVWRVELADDDPRVSLKPEVWTGRTTGERAGSTEWATVTPIVFDRHPKETWGANDPPRVRAERQAAYWSEVEDMIADACERIGLPRPVQGGVTATPASVFKGAASSGHMPRMLRKDGTQKRQTHAVIRFAQPVVGPVLLGAGRYRGYGLCRPVPNPERRGNGGVS